MRERRPIGERFWPKVRKTDGGCWEWTGARSPFGHGVMQRGGRGEGTVRTHRWAWEMFVGPIPEGMCVCHRCDNPPCVNPLHLFLGTTGDNTRDMHSKGRSWQLRTTHCPAGHPYDDENTRLTREGRRRCRACRRIQRRTRKERTGVWQ